MLQPMSPQNKVIMSPRPNLNNFPIIARNNTIFAGQKLNELQKSPIINRKIVFPERSHVLTLSQAQNNSIPQTFLNTQQ